MRVTIALSSYRLTVSSGAARAPRTQPRTRSPRGAWSCGAVEAGAALEVFKRAHALAPSARTSGQWVWSRRRWNDGSTRMTHLKDRWRRRTTPGCVRTERCSTRALGGRAAHVGEAVITGPAGTEVAVDANHVGTLPADCVRP